MWRYRESVFSVYQEGSFSKAALRLHVSQPALSAAVKKAEEEFGHPIFNRGVSPITLTEYGRYYIDSLIQLNGVEEELKNRVANLDMLSTGEITIGTNHVYAALLFPELLSLFHRRWPRIRLTLLEGSAVSNEERLLDGAIDLVLDCGERPNRSDALDYISVGSELLFLAGQRPVLLKYAPAEALISGEDIIQGRCHAPACPTVPLRQFRDAEFVLLTPGNDTRFREDQMLLEAGVTPATSIEVEQMATSYQLLDKSDLLTFVSETLVKHRAPRTDLAYCKLDSRYAVRELYFSYVRRKYLRKAVTTFIQFAKGFPF